jgi:hypothetical protein
MDLQYWYTIDGIEYIREELTCGCGRKEDDEFVIGWILMMDYVLDDGD